jgi:Kef-type K+ transport system membrane component KefB
MSCKLFGTLIAAKLIKKDWLSSFNLSMAMNARGGPGIVLATVAFDMGVISETFFSSLVLLAITTSLIAGYWFRFVLRNSCYALDDKG